jgi:dTDP-glucose pyrophosphorylase
MTLKNKNKYLIDCKATIHQTLKKINESGSKCLVVTKNGYLDGTISDGDIRSALLKGKKKSLKIYKVYNSKPITVNQNNVSLFKIEKIFQKKFVDIIPIINDNKKIVNIITLANFLKNKSNLLKKKILCDVFISAGGEGKRLQPFTDILPKPLIPINNKTVIERVIDQFIDYKIKNYFISVNFKKDVIKAFFKEKKNKNNISFVEEKKKLGTAGALSLVKNKISKFFFVSNCDILIKHNIYQIYKFHIESKNDLTIVVSNKNLRVPYGDCKIDKNGNLSSIVEKPVLNFLAITGFYIFSKSCLKELKQNKKIEMNNFIEDLKQKNYKIGTYNIPEKEWLDIGEWNEYKKTIEVINKYEN